MSRSRRNRLASRRTTGSVCASNLPSRSKTATAIVNPFNFSERPANAWSTRWRSNAFRCAFATNAGFARIRSSWLRASAADGLLSDFGDVTALPCPEPSTGSFTPVVRPGAYVEDRTKGIGLYAPGLLCGVRVGAATVGAMAFITGKRSAPNRLRFRKEWGRASSATNTCGCRSGAGRQSRRRPCRLRRRLARRSGTSTGPDPPA